MCIVTMLHEVKVVSEQVCLESFAENGRRVCCPYIGREFVPPLRHQNREVDGDSTGQLM